MNPKRKCFTFFPLLCQKQHCRFCGACGVTSGVLTGNIDMFWYCPECSKYQRENKMTWGDMMGAHG